MTVTEFNVTHSLLSGTDVKEQRDAVVPECRRLLMSFLTATVPGRDLEHVTVKLRG